MDVTRNASAKKKKKKEEGKIGCGRGCQVCRVGEEEREGGSEHYNWYFGESHGLNSGQAEEKEKEKGGGKRKQTQLQDASACSGGGIVKGTKPSILHQV